MKNRKTDKGEQLCHHLLMKNVKIRVIKNVNFVNDIFYFTVLFGEWALQA